MTEVETGLLLQINDDYELVTARFDSFERSPVDSEIESMQLGISLLFVTVLHSAVVHLSTTVKMLF